MRGTVRAADNVTKMRPIAMALGEDLFSQVEIVNADLLDPDSLTEALKDSTYVVHTASPFFVASENPEQELIRPAVDGTVNTLRAAYATKAKRVVVTSSCVAVLDPEEKPADFVYSERHWTDPNGKINYYSKSKT